MQEQDSRRNVLFLYMLCAYFFNTYLSNYHHIMHVYSVDFDINTTISIFKRQLHGSGLHHDFCWFFIAGNRQEDIYDRRNYIFRVTGIAGMGSVAVDQLYHQFPVFFQRDKFQCAAAGFKSASNPVSVGGRWYEYLPRRDFCQ